MSADLRLKSNSLVRNGSTDLLRYEALFLIATGVYTFLLVFEFPVTPIFFSGDDLNAIYQGWRMVLGDSLYKDIFEFTLPGTPTYYWLAISTFGTRFWILRATVVLIAIVSAFLCLRISRELIPTKLYFLPAFIYIFFGFKFYGLDGSHRMFSPIFVLIALLLIIRQRSRWGICFAGIMCGLSSFFTQQRGVVAVALIAVYVLADQLRQGNGYVAGVKNAATVLAGFMVSLFVFCFYFVQSAGIDQFVYSVLEFPIKYYGTVPVNNYWALYVNLPELTVTKPHILLLLVFFLLVLPITVVVAAVYLIRNRRTPWEEIRHPVLIALIGMGMLFITLGPQAGRIFQVSIPLLILSVWLFYKNRTISERHKLLLFRGSLIILTLFATALAYRQQTLSFTKLSTPTGNLAIYPEEQYKRIIWVGQELVEGDAFFETYPSTYFPLKLRNPSKYSQILPYEYTQPNHIDEVVDSLRSDPPKLIVWDNSLNVPSTTRRPDDHTGPLADFVKSGYSPVGSEFDVFGSPLQVWKRNDYHPLTQAP